MATPTRAQAPTLDVDVLAVNQIQRLPFHPEAVLDFQPCQIAEGETNALGMQLHLPARVAGWRIRARGVVELEVASLAKILAVGFDLAGVEKSAAETLDIAQQMAGILDNAMTSTAEKLKTDMLDAWDADAEMTIAQLQEQFDVTIEGDHPFTRSE